MEIKSILGSFWQLTHVVRIAGVQFLSIFCVAYAIAHIGVVNGIGGCPPSGEMLGYFFLVSVFIGLVATSIALFFIFFPAVWLQRIGRQLLFANTDLHLPFLSTRPVYVILDLVLLIPAIVFLNRGLAETTCRFNFDWVFGWAFFLMTLFYPVLRTFSWTLLNRKIVAKQVRVPWGTLIMWLVLAIPLTFLATYLVLELRYLPRLRTPVVTKENYRGGLDANPGLAAGVVRVQGKLIRGISKCGLSETEVGTKPFPSATVVIDMGDGTGQILVKANGPSDVALLESDAAGKEGQSIEVFGRLSKLPNPRKKDICGLYEMKARTAGRGLALLEIELPTD